ncbi:hypothetical protein AEGHOMDF_3369 [Methylobacterium soli]|nr:hypothetical protein AEGHOMDF_3369 [Methylobacterium soli]
MRPAPDLIQAIPEQRQRGLVQVQDLTVEGQVHPRLRTVDRLDDGGKICEEHGWTGLDVMGVLWLSAAFSHEDLNE